MTHDFHPDARKEYLDAVVWHEKNRLGSGEQFIAEVEGAIGIILSDPGRFQRVGDEIRIFRLRRFPYYLYYESFSDSEHIRIYAIAHNRRKPDYWLYRLRR
ncbi:MAG: type II toxin-antitoxin system RelE/ParE family toxin [Verrucomicrobiaceae bacterium]|nr:type II toxin-antitoxin system RelE/ParE family toxin [Verrucomicrobiaceae bacterium]